MSKTMLYKFPGPYFIHRMNMDYTVIDSNEVESYLEKGWSRTPIEAKNKTEDEKEVGVADSVVELKSSKQKSSKQKSSKQKSSKQKSSKPKIAKEAEVIIEEKVIDSDNIPDELKVLSKK